MRVSQRLPTRPSGRGVLVLVTMLALSATVWGVQAVGIQADGVQESEAQESGQLVDVGGHRLHIDCLGEGGPVVVFDVGIGESSASWRPLQLRLAGETTACVYDRAGYGASESGPEPRTASVVADELHRLLEGATVPGPYVLVGHSLGALHAIVFAHQFPEATTGLLLLDPPPRAFLRGEAFPELSRMLAGEAEGLALAARQAAESENPEERAQAAYLGAVASEYASLTSATLREADAVKTLGDLPLIVLGSTRPNPAFGEPAAAFQAFWLEQSRELAGTLSRRSEFLATDTSHHIHLDAPETVLEAIERLLRGRI